MNELMFIGLAGMIAVWIALQFVPSGYMKLDALLALLFLASIAAALVGAGGVMR